jgi:hypothetical protein
MKNKTTSSPLKTHKNNMEMAGETEAGWKDNLGARGV